MSLCIKIILISALFVFLFLNYAVYLKEELKQDGKTMLLQLAPRNPYALEQRGSMDLRYTIEPVISKQYGAVIRVDAQGIGQFVALYTGQELGKNEIIMPYSVRNGTVYIAPNEFNFLPKEHIEYYEKAEYALFKYNTLGHKLLIGLADKSGAEIVPPSIAGKESESNLFNWHENKLRDDKHYEMLMEQGRTMLLPITIIEPVGYQLPTLTKFHYSMDPKIAATLIKGYAVQGQAVIVIDEQNRGHFKKLYAGEDLKTNETLISYFIRDGNSFLDPYDTIFSVHDTFLFQEGHTQYYKNAYYGVFKYDGAGNNLLIGLADKSGTIIEPPKK